jgi:hypothetical protein
MEECISSASRLATYLSRFFNLWDKRWFRAEFFRGWFRFRLDIGRFGQGRQAEFVFDPCLDPEGVPPFCGIDLFAMQNEAKV